MNKIIVTTTINHPTEATKKFASMTDWHLVIAGDLKTPHDEYKKMIKIPVWAITINYCLNSEIEKEILSKIKEVF